MNDVKYVQCRICGLIDSTSVMRRDEATEFEYLCPECYSYEYPSLDDVLPQFVGTSPNASRTKLRIKQGRKPKSYIRKES